MAFILSILKRKPSGYQSKGLIFCVPEKIIPLFPQFIGKGSRGIQNTLKISRFLQEIPLSKLIHVIKHVTVRISNSKT